MRNRSRRW